MAHDNGNNVARMTREGKNLPTPFDQEERRQELQNWHPADPHPVLNPMEAMEDNLQRFRNKLEDDLKFRDSQIRELERRQEDLRLQYERDRAELQRMTDDERYHRQMDHQGIIYTDTVLAQVRAAAIQPPAEVSDAGKKQIEKERKKSKPNDKPEGESGESNSK